MWFFLQRGRYLDPLPRDIKWDFTPSVKLGDSIESGETLGTVPEGLYEHRIMVPFSLVGKWTVTEIAAAGSYTVEKVIATIQDEKGNIRDCQIMQKWPVKVPIQCYTERLRPQESMATKLRTIDTFFPVAKGEHTVFLDHLELVKQCFNK